jgi:hypothetical protein
MSSENRRKLGVNIKIGIREVISKWISLDCLMIGSAIQDLLLYSNIYLHVTTAISKLTVHRIRD